VPARGGLRIFRVDAGMVDAFIGVMIELSISHILFPYDFSTQGQLAAAYVRALAARVGARVTLFSVVPPAFASVPAAMGGEALHAGAQSTGWKHALQCQLDRALLDELDGIDVDRVADCGDAGLRIGDFAHNHAVDLVMMPTHGLGLFRAMLSGSVTSKVLHDVRCPVWTAVHAETQHTPVIPRSILCAVEATTEGVSLLQYAALLSKKVGASLSVLHVVEPISDWPSLARERELQEQVRDTAEQAVASMLASTRVEAHSRVVIGDIVTRAAEAAREQHADLLIVGRGAIAEPFGRFRAHSFGIIEQSPCPVLSV
jgi:nucleotide-binding universal stress UspA family protein